VIAAENLYYQFIYDIDEIEWFYKFSVPRIEQDKVLFWSLSARNKILSEEERRTFMLGRSEMFKKSVIRKNGFSHFIESLRSAECHKQGMLTKARVPYPQKCLRLYWNLNPTSVRKVIFEQQRLINEYNEEMIAAALKKSDIAIESAFHKMRRIFDAHYRCTQALKPKEYGRILKSILIRTILIKKNILILKNNREFF